MNNADRTEYSAGGRAIYRGYLLLAGLQCIVSLALTLQARSEGGGFLGLSSFRLLLAGGLLLALLGCAGLLLETRLRPEAVARRWQRIAARLAQPRPWWWAFLACGAVFVTGVLFLAHLPGFQEPVAIAYGERLAPPAALAAGLAAQTGAALLLLRRRAGAFAAAPMPRLFFLTLAIFAGILVAWGWAARNVLPAESLRVGWNRQGAPLIEIQVFAAWGLSVALLALDAWRGRAGRREQPERGLFRGRLDVWLSILIWVAAVIAWQSRPIEPNWFLTRPFPPNFENYPSSDARGYDTAAQTALVGEGYIFYGSLYIRRSLLAFYMTALRLLGGQDYARVIFLQILVLALIPVVIYHLTRSLHTRAAGVLAAALVILREANSIRIAGSETTSNVKLLMADMPAMLLTAFFALLVILWLKRARTDRLGALLCGGGLGLAMLIRLETAILLLPVGLAAAPVLWKPPRFGRWVQSMLLVLLGVGLVVSPWVVRNYLRTGMIFIDSPYFLNDLIFQRFNPARNAEPQPGGAGEQSLRIPARGAPFADAAPFVDAAPFAAAAPFADAAPFAAPAPKVALAPPAWQEPTPTPPAPAPDAPMDPGFFAANLGGFSRSAAAHFLHSQVQLFFTLPSICRGFESSLSFAAHRSPQRWWQECCGVETYVRALPFWNRWDGEIPGASLWLLLINLSLTAWGVQTAWRRAGWAGLTPALLAVTYLALNSLFRNSGGRYILPVDWSILVFFSIGLAQVTQDLGGRLFGRPAAAEAAKEWIAAEADTAALPAAPAGRLRPAARLLLACLALLAIGSLPALLERSIPRRYNRARVEDMVRQVQRTELLSAAERDVLNTYLNRGAGVAPGRALYPRYFAPNASDPNGRGEMFEARPYPRITFFLAGVFNGNMALPIERKPKNFPNGQDALLIMCPDLDIVALALYAPNGALSEVMLHSPFPAEATCPLP